jgi:hypothetical protein
LCLCAGARAQQGRSRCARTVAGLLYEVEPDLAGETVVLWFGLYDDQLYVEHREHRYGPYGPIDGPIPLHRYRRFKNTRTQDRADRIEVLADHLALPRAALTANLALGATLAVVAPPTQDFADPDPSQELAFRTALDAKRASADELGRRLAKLPPEQLAALNAFLATTLAKPMVWDYVRRHRNPSYKG